MMFCRQSNAGTSWSSQCINFQPETIEVLSLISSAICEYSAFYIKEMESKVKYIHSNLNWHGLSFQSHLYINSVWVAKWRWRAVQRNCDWWGGRARWGCISVTNLNNVGNVGQGGWGFGGEPNHGKESHLSRVVGDCRNNSKRGGCGGGGSRSCLEKVILLVSLPLTVMEQYSVENWIPLCAGWNASFVSDEIPLNRTGCCVTLVPLS